MKEQMAIRRFARVYLGCAAVAAFCLSGCGSYQADEARPMIVNGQSVEGGAIDASAQAVFEIWQEGSQGTQRFVCTGTLVGPHTGLTAAHCFAHLMGSVEQVRYFARFQVADGSESASIELSRIQGHPNFVPLLVYSEKRKLRPAHDIALVTLDRAVTISRKPLPLAAHFLDDVVSNVTVYGFGTNGLVKQKSPHVPALAKVNIPITAHHRAGSIFETRPPTSVPKGVCSGDSGSPALQKRNDAVTIVGVLSAGDNKTVDSDGDGTPDYLCNGSGVFTAIEPYLPWIQDFIGSL